MSIAGTDEFHAYHCYLPLYVFAGKTMLACMLQRGQTLDFDAIFIYF
jgi:hypothetical protein